MIYAWLGYPTSKSATVELIVKIAYNSCLRGFLRGEASSTLGSAAAAANIEKAVGRMPGPGGEKQKEC